jgi:hypothetical protein
MAGRITTRHLVIHAWIIIQAFGVEAYLKAWWIAIRGGTFLEAIRYH